MKPVVLLKFRPYWLIMAAFWLVVVVYQFAAAQTNGQSTGTTEAIPETKPAVERNFPLQQLEYVHLQALDKVTARISDLFVKAGSSVSFGLIDITARSCYNHPPQQVPESYAYTEIIERQLEGEAKLIFSGWMFASSPALNSLQHPIYDVWVKNCLTQPPAAN